MKARYMALGGLAAMIMPFVPSCSSTNHNLEFSPAVIFSRYEEGHSWVIASVRVTVDQEPRTFFAHAHLQRRVLLPTGFLWLNYATKGFSKPALPPPGYSKELQIRALCKKGTWRVTLTVSGVSASGAVFPPTSWKSAGKRIRSCAKPPRKARTLAAVFKGNGCRDSQLAAGVTRYRASGRESIYHWLARHDQAGELGNIMSATVQCGPGFQQRKQLLWLSRSLQRFMPKGMIFYDINNGPDSP